MSTLEAQPVRLVRASTLAAAVSALVTVGGYTLVFDETTKQLSIAVGGTLTAFPAAAIAKATFIAQTAAITGGEPPTEAEFNALVAKVNAIQTALINAGIMASS